MNEEQFLKDVARHQIEIIHDNILTRHIRFAASNTPINYFDLITWNGHLCYTGDMGTYVFKRAGDMFEFFRGSPSRVNCGETLGVHLDYWSGKVIAEDTYSGVTAYSPELATKVIMEWMDAFKCDDDFRQYVKDAIMVYAHDGEDLFRQAIRDCDDPDGIFSDFMEADLTVYTDGFIWACYAIAWGIQQYDQATSRLPSPQPPG